MNHLHRIDPKRWGKLSTHIALRICLLGLLHTAVFLAAYWLAYCLRFDFVVPASSLQVFWLSLPLVLGIKLTTFYFSGHFHGWWRHVTFADLSSLLRAAVLSSLFLAVIDYFFFPFQIPRSVLLIDCFATILILGALRSSWRLCREQLWPSIARRDYCRALLVGADHSSGKLAHQLNSHPELKYRIRGFLDPAGSKIGATLGGIPVLGSAERVQEVAAKYHVKDVLAVAGALPGKQLRDLKQACDAGGLSLKIIPPVEDLFKGNGDIPIRDIDIGDLLRRDCVQLDMQSIGEMLEGVTVMVTGAGGSIGSEICRQVLKFKPRRLVLLGKGEHSIFEIHHELQLLDLPTVLDQRIADVTDQRRMRQIFQEFEPDVVFHAAAHKHVPLMETNPGEAIKNNVFGTKCVADLANKFDVKSFVYISSDKAVNPTSVMGVSKQIGERYIHTLSQDSSTRFMVVRFGNVLGSTGSVVPLFKQQIRRGGPITVTDERMTRYFMTIPEASQLVLQAASMGQGGEIFVLDMGEPVKISDLARDLIRLSGLPEDAIEITYTGIRPGEKLYEELYFGEEQTLATPHAKVRAACHRPYALDEVSALLAELAKLQHEPSQVILQRLHEWIPEFQTRDTAPDSKTSDRDCQLASI